MSPQANPRSVCIIGAGAAGLCALRHFAHQPENFNPVECFEASNQIGGTWNYTEQTGTDDSGLSLHTSMYRDLHTNLPMQIMAYPDFPWTAIKSFVHHRTVLQYLHDYASHYALAPYISLKHNLLHLTRENGQWKVTLQDLIKGETLTRLYDILLLCPGRHSRPFKPIIRGLSHFPGWLIHSHDYRFREPYTGQRVAIIGGGPSGFDLAIEVSTVARQIIFINTTAFQFENLPSNVRQINGQIEAFHGRELMVKVKQSGTLEAYSLDSVILTTGYRFNLDYLDQKGTGITLNDDDTLDGLYRQMVNIAHPSMAMLGICQKGVLPFPTYHQQILYFMKLLLGEIPMPTVEEMQQDVREDLVMRAKIGYRPRDRHSLKVEVLVEYIEKLEKEANLEPLKPVVMKLHADLYSIRCLNLRNYKAVNYQLVDEETYKVVEEEDGEKIKSRTVC